jgi:hypothetical protein
MLILSKAKNTQGAIISPSWNRITLDFQYFEHLECLKNFLDSSMFPANRPGFYDVVGSHPVHVEKFSSLYRIS